ELGEALADAALDDVLELDGAQHPGAVGDPQRRGPGPGDAVHRGTDLVGDGSAQTPHMRLDRVGGALAHLAPVQVDAAHPSLRGEGDEGGPHLLELALAATVLR